MKTAFTMVVFAISAACLAHAQDIVGDWQGTLKDGSAELRVVLHIAKSEGGGLRATLDSIDQGANGIPVNSIVLKDSKLNLIVDAVHGTYEGKVNANATEIAGTWSQGQPLPLDFKRATTPVKTEHKPAKPSDIDGAWIGTLDTGVMKLRVVFHITNTEDGLTGTMDSPDQNALGLPVTAVTRDGSSLKIELKQIAGAFEGKIAKDLATIEGTWTQGGATLPLVLKRVKDAAELERRRPQNPVKPYPYREEEVSYDNPAAGIKLAATLTIPPGNEPHPAAFLITGSGPQDRDESLMGHRPFLVLADYLTRHGIVVLRADDRGVGKSGGNFATATTADFATDAEAGVAHLKTRSEVDPHKIGLIGHSEGGIVAPMVAVRNSDVAFVVMMAGSGVPGDEILVAQVRLLSEAAGRSHEQAEKSAAEEREVLALVKQEKDDAVLEKKLREKLGGKIPEAQLGAQLKAVSSPWFRYFLEYDPAVALRKVKCPVLAINGEKDLQVPPKQNLPVIRKALEASGNKDFEVDELPGLNHLFQTAKTGLPSEYAEIEETMAPTALESICDWILTHTESR
jgi:pimeloyl-ACP methyl ester carboxylesterase